MHEDVVKHGEVFGRITTLPPREERFAQALYVDALAKFYPALKLPYEQLSATQMVILQQAVEFAEIARHVVDMHGLPFEFPSNQAAPEDVNAAFMHFLRDETGLWDALRTAIKVLNRPNGVAGAHPDQLTDAEKKAPTLPESEPSTSEA